jgi:hypothetical protein
VVDLLVWLEWVPFAWGNRGLLPAVAPLRARRRGPAQCEDGFVGVLNANGVSWVIVDRGAAG